MQMSITVVAVFWCIVFARSLQNDYYILNVFCRNCRFYQKIDICNCNGCLLGYGCMCVFVSTYVYICVNVHTLICNNWSILLRHKNVTYTHCCTNIIYELDFTFRYNVCMCACMCL